MRALMKNKTITIGIILLFIILSFNNLSSSKTIKNIDIDNLFLTGFNFKILDNRIFFWKQPDFSPQDGGYPVLFLFHGASQHALAWFIGFNQLSKYETIFTRKALENGFFIIAPESLRPVWYAQRGWDIYKNHSNSKDYIFIENIIKWLDNSELPIDKNGYYCAGFSSGAFMSSFIGHNFNNKFNAIAVHSGGNSYSVSLTTRGPIYDLESVYDFSPFYPPTIVIHGEKDFFVPVQCAENFYSDLKRNNIQSSLIIDQYGDHIWLSQYDFEILNWFCKYEY
jgi:poly(3-hydroxybutyrate) depolymerase